MERLRKLFPALPRDVYVFLAADFLSAVGSGMTLPFLVVYLHTARGMSLSAAGLAAATVALASLIGNPVGGAVADRVGPRAALAAGLAIAGVGALALSGVGEAWQAFVACGLSGLGVAIAWPAQDALVARLVPAGQRASAYGMRYATMNLGLAAGALSAAVVVDAGRSSFVLLYWLDAASFLLAIPVLGLVGKGAADHAESSAVDAESSAVDAEPAGGYRLVARDRVFRRLWLLTAVLVGVGYGQFHAAFPVYLTEVAGLRPGILSLAYVANMATVVLAQLLALRMLRGPRRSSALAAVALIWGATWGAVLVAGQVGPGFAVALAVVAAVAFGVGETLLAPTVPAIVNDIAAEHLRGRYNAASALAYTSGFVVGPAVAGLALDHGRGTMLMIGLVVACGLAAVQATRLGRRLPPHANSSVPEPAPPRIPPPRIEDHLISWPGENRPGENRPGENRPGENRPGENRPGENQPGEKVSPA